MIWNSSTWLILSTNSGEDHEGLQSPFYQMCMWQTELWTLFIILSLIFTEQSFHCQKYQAYSLIHIKFFLSVSCMRTHCLGLSHSDVYVICTANIRVVKSFGPPVVPACYKYTDPSSRKGSTAAKRALRYCPELDWLEHAAPDSTSHFIKTREERFPPKRTLCVHVT